MHSIRLRTGKSAHKWLKDNIPNWNDDYVQVNHYSGRCFQVTFVLDGKLKSFLMDDYEFETLVPKFTDYFKGYGWDHNDYFEIYGGCEQAVSKVFQCKSLDPNLKKASPDTYIKLVDEWRAKFDNGVGIRLVPRPPTWVPYREGFIGQHHKLILT